MVTVLTLCAETSLRSCEYVIVTCPLLCVAGKMKNSTKNITNGMIHR